MKTVKKKNKGTKTSYSGTRHLKNTQSYPVAFGLHIQRCLPFLCSSGTGQPASESHQSGPDLFLSHEWGDLWPEAKVLDACIYMRGSIHLKVSARWKAVFPTHIPIE